MKLLNQLPAVSQRLMLVFIAISTLLAGCASNKPQIEVNEEQNFAAIQTFHVQGPLNTVNPTIENHLASSITSILIKKGLTPADKKVADMEVGFFPATARKENGKSVSFGLGTGVFGRHSGISLGSIFSVPVGDQVSQYQTLQIDMVKDGTFVYSAVGSAELDANDSITIQRELTNLVNELLAPYPNKADK